MSAPAHSDGVRIHDIRIAGTEAYLVEPVEGGRGPGLIFLHWFDTEPIVGGRVAFRSPAAAAPGPARG